MSYSDSDWFPGTEPEQLIVVQNIDDKIDNYLVQLDITPTRQTKIHLLCQTFKIAVTKTQELRDTAEALTQWKKSVKHSVDKKGDPAPAPPDFMPFTLPGGATLGVVDQLRDEVGLWKKEAGYTPAIGADLMIVGSGGTDVNPDTLAPLLDVESLAGYKLRVKWIMNGMDALRFEYQRKGTEIWQPYFLTKSPGEVVVVPAVAGQAESGLVRGVFIKNNQPFGIHSDLKPVTLS